MEIDKVNVNIETLKNDIFESKKMNKELVFRNQDMERQILEKNNEINDKENDMMNLKKSLEQTQNQNVDYKEDNKILNNDVQMHLQIIEDLENINRNVNVCIDCS